MNAAHAAWRLFHRSLEVIMGSLLFAMMALTTIDVIGRYFFKKPISGGFEIVQYMMALVVFASFPLTTASDSHLTVSILTDRLTGRARQIHRIVVLSISAVAVFVIAWRMGSQAAIQASARQASGFLQIPLAPISWTMSALAWLMFVVTLALIWRTSRGTVPASPRTEATEHEINR